MLSNFDISSNGFCPEYCVKTLPGSLYIYTEFAEMMPNYESVAYRNAVLDRTRELHEPSAEILRSLELPIVRCLYSTLSMVINKYIWCGGGENYVDTIPRFLGIPWITAARRLGIAASLTHAAVDLYNWSLVDPALPFDAKIESLEVTHLDNLAVNYTMTGSKDEAWFYLVMIHIEFVGGKLLPKIERLYDTLQNCDDRDISASISVLLRGISDDIFEMTMAIGRMRQFCRPEYFFNVLRIFLSGNAPKNDGQYFPNGLIIDGFDEPIKFEGGSAAQSSLIQVLDVVFQAESTPGCPHSKKYLGNMHQYMPSAHRDFIGALLAKRSSGIDIRSWIQRDQSCVTEYNDVLESLSAFRKAHFGLVRDYVLKFIAQPLEHKNNVHGAKGSGGTDPASFLTDLISATQASQLIIVPQRESTKLWRWQYLWILVAIIGVFFYSKN